MIFTSPTHTHTRMHAHTHACMHTRTHTCTHAHMHMCTCTHARTHTHTHTRTHTHTHTHTHAHTRTHMHAHTRTHTHTEQLKITEGSLGGRVLRSEHQVSLPTSLPLPEQRKRKQLTPAQLEERRRKVGIQLITPPSFTLHTHILTLPHHTLTLPQREEARAKRMKLFIH